MIDVKLDKNDIVIRFPNGMISNELIEKFFERLEIEELAEKNKMTEKQGEEISEEITSSWWNKNKESFFNDFKKLK